MVPPAQVNPSPAPTSRHREVHLPRQMKGKTLKLRLGSEVRYLSLRCIHGLW